MPKPERYRAFIIAAIVASAVLGSLTWLNLTPEVQRFSGSTRVYRGWPLIAHSQLETRFQPSFRKGLTDTAAGNGEHAGDWRAIGFDSGLAALLCGTAAHTVFLAALAMGSLWRVGLSQLFLHTCVVAALTLVLMYEIQIWRGVGQILNSDAVYPQDVSWRQPLFLGLPVMASFYCLILRIVKFLEWGGRVVGRRLLPRFRIAR